MLVNGSTDSDGGCILLLGISTFVHSCTFSSCHAAHLGGAIGAPATAAHVEVTSTTISECSASYGGGIGILGNLTLDNCNLTLNTAVYNGGAVNIQGSGSSLAARRTLIADNTALTGCGGGIAARLQNATLVTCRQYSPRDSIGTMSVVLGDSVAIRNNYALSRGGGVYAQGPLTLVLSGDAVVADNSAGRGGGVTAVHAVSIDLSGRVAVRGNAAVGAGDGGGLHLSCRCDVRVGGAARFEANEASPYNLGYGGAIFADDTALRLGGRAVFDANRADDGAGGAVFAQAAQTTAEDDVLFVGNSAFSGGALCVIWSPPVRLAGQARFERNAAYQGGAVTVQRADLELDGLAVFRENQATTGGAVIAMAGAVSVAGGVAFLGNAVRAEGGALSLFVGSALTVGGGGVEFRGNAADRGGAFSLSESTAQVGGGARARDNTAVFGGAFDVRWEWGLGSKAMVGLGARECVGRGWDQESGLFGREGGWGEKKGVSCCQ